MSRKWSVVLVLFAGYAGYYTCRSYYSVCLPLLQRELVESGLDAAVAVRNLGLVASIGTLAYALGKLFGGAACDQVGGRRFFILGMTGSAIATFAFATAGHVPLFTLCWALNRVFQSFGWLGIVKIIPKWFAYSSHGRVMAVISLSYLLGDAGVRALYGVLIVNGCGWRDILNIGAGLLAIALVATALILRESPDGAAAPPGSPGVLVSRDDESAHSAAVAIYTSRVFWLICVMCFGLTVLRESLNLWIPVYLVDVSGYTPARAAATSALFPLLGVASVVLAGLLSDLLGPVRRGIVIVFCLAVVALLLAQLLIGDHIDPGITFALIGFFLFGPFSYMSGVLAMDLGGRRSSATVSGSIDFFGYLGGILAGGPFATLFLTNGWGAAYCTLASVAILTAVVASLLTLAERARSLQRIN